MLYSNKNKTAPVREGGGSVFTLADIIGFSHQLGIRFSDSQEQSYSVMLERYSQLRLITRLC